MNGTDPWDNPHSDLPFVFWDVNAAGHAFLAWVLALPYSFEEDTPREIVDAGDRHFRGIVR